MIKSDSICHIFEKILAYTEADRIPTLFLSPISIEFLPYGSLSRFQLMAVAVGIERESWTHSKSVFVVETQHGCWFLTAPDESVLLDELRKSLPDSSKD